MRLREMTETLRTIPLRRVARMLAVIGTVLAAFLHIVFGMHAGALWRDEVNSLELATVRTLPEVWASLDYDSFPALFFLVLRTFAGVPANATDTELRVFGVAIGLLITGALWFNARLLYGGFPLVSLALVGFNAMVIRYGDSVRAYGLGIFLMLLTFAAMWKVVESPSRRRVFLAALVAVLSVQCLYYNAILLFALCLGALAVTWRHRQWQRAAIVLGIGVAAALSLLPYVPTILRVRAWNFQFKAPISFAFLWGKLSETIGSPVNAAVWAWVIVFAMAIGAGIWVLLRKSWEDELPLEKDRVLFALVTLLVGTASYAGFLKVLSYVTQPWYYVVFIAFAAVCLEMLFASLPAKAWHLSARSGFALVFIGTTTFPAWQALQARQTNVDLIAARLESLANKDDLVLINTWNYGIPFRRYYHGPARCATIPPVEDLRFHRCDIIKRQMMSPAPIAPVLQKISDTLRAGNTVWLIGALRFVAPGQQPQIVPRGYDGPTGWVGTDFYGSWSEQAGFVFQKHARSFERVQVSVTQPVSHYENLPLSAFQGWRGETDISAR
jgi:hypothetical protein